MEHAQQTFKLSVPSSTMNLAMIREFVELSARRSTLAEGDLLKLTAGVDEACANVMEHSYRNDDTREITIHVWFDDTQLGVDVIDSGPRFDPNLHKSLDLKDLVGHKGGMGIRIMKAATDDLVLDTDENGHNRLRLIKRLVP